MVALEAWALGKPVLANGRCDVLRGQCVRSNAGLYYETFEEFAEGAVPARGDRPAGRRARPERPRVLPASLHLAGDRAEVSRHVRPARTRAGAGLEPLPGFFARRAATLPPARRGHGRGAVGTGGA